MPISHETRIEIDSALHTSGHIPLNYVAFIVKWMAFNRAYNELETRHRDWDRVESFAEHNQGHWPELVDLVTDLVSIECIGSEPVQDSHLVAPKSVVKSATFYLRERLGLASSIDPAHCIFRGCTRDEKKRICDRVNVQPWTQSELTALMRLVYQVRCNLMHGEKRLRNDDEFQTNRDHQLIRISSQILDRILYWLL